MPRALCLSCCAIVAAVAAGCLGPAPATLGATERVHVREAGLDFLAVVDTGAHRSSIHALDLRIPEPADEMHRNIGKRVEFRVANERGQSRRIATTIADVRAVRTTRGSEWRYIVPLHLSWQGVEREVLVNLRDRTPMTYKLLVGRDWIRGLLVDVRRNSPD